MSIFKRKKRESKAPEKGSFIQGISELVVYYQLIAMVLLFLTLFFGFDMHQEPQAKRGLFLGALGQAVFFMIIYYIHNWRSNKPIVNRRSSSDTSGTNGPRAIITLLKEINRVPQIIGIPKDIFFPADQTDRKIMLKNKDEEIKNYFASIVNDDEFSELMSVIYRNNGGETERFLDALSDEQLNLLVNSSNSK